jgi:hypothetical protein
MVGMVVQNSESLDTGEREKAISVQIQSRIIMSVLVPKQIQNTNERHKDWRSRHPIQANPPSE